jgi:hypothetical protein
MPQAQRIEPMLAMEKAPPRKNWTPKTPGLEIPPIRRGISSNPAAVVIY